MIKVLIVEDERPIARAIARLVDQHPAFGIVGMETNGEAALAFLRKTPVDLVITDIQMPVMNGYDSTRHIRALERPDIKSMPIIAMSANAFAEDIKLCKESGMNEHIAKPIDFGKVLEILEKYL